MNSGFVRSSTLAILFFKQTLNVYPNNNCHQNIFQTHGPLIGDFLHGGFKTFANTLTNDEKSWRMRMH